MSNPVTSLIPGLDAISASLGAATPIATIPRPESKALSTDVKESPEIEDDYQEARSNLKELIGQAMENVPELMELTRQSQSEKMYQAAASFLTAAANLNISLSKLSKEIKRQPVPKGQQVQPSENPGQTIQQNNVFIGSTEDFLSMMEDRRKNAQVIDAQYEEVEPQT